LQVSVLQNPQTADGDKSQVDTVDANLALGYESDAREYAGAAEVLQILGVQRVRLLTNNVEKVAGLQKHGIDVTQRIPLITTPSADNLRYLWTKQTRMDHHLDHTLIDGGQRMLAAPNTFGFRSNGAPVRRVD
jgi:hypothetical protein